LSAAQPEFHELLTRPLLACARKIRTDSHPTNTSSYCDGTSFRMGIGCVSMRNELNASNGNGPILVAASREIQPQTWQLHKTGMFSLHC
jgi:hypothetical protein